MIILRSSQLRTLNHPNIGVHAILSPSHQMSDDRHIRKPTMASLERINRLLNTNDEVAVVDVKFNPFALSIAIDRKP